MACLATKTTSFVEVVLVVALVVAQRLLAVVLGVVLAIVLAVMLGVVFAIVMEADCASRGRPLPVAPLADTAEER